MSRVGVGIAQEVCEGDGGEGVVVGVRGAVEFNHLVTAAVELVM